MSQENVEIVRQALAATRNGNADGGQAVFDPSSIEWEMSGVPEWPEKSVYRGGEVGEFLRLWAESWQDWHFDVTDLRDADGDRVFAGIHEWGIGVESKVSVDQYRYLVSTVRSGRITRVQMFSDRGQALEAAGLRE
jgi:ketosteroid isomerase-like protein